MHKKSN